MKRTAALIFALILLLAGCRKEDIVPHRVVTRIDVTCQAFDTYIRRCYTKEEKMQMVLFHIRNIGQRHTPDIDPDTLDTPTICITLHFSDGSRKVYRQKDNRFWQEDTQPWKKINMENASGLWQTVLMTPGDIESDRTAAIPPPGISNYRGLAG